MRHNLRLTGHLHGVASLAGVAADRLQSIPLGSVNHGPHATLKHRLSSVRSRRHWDEH